MVQISKYSEFVTGRSAKYISFYLPNISHKLDVGQLTTEVPEF